MNNHLKKLFFIWTFVFIASLCWLVLSPIFYANVDEHNFLRTANSIASLENIATDSELLKLAGFKNADSEYVSKYNLGQSIILAPNFVLINYIHETTGTSKLQLLPLAFISALFAFILIIHLSLEILKKLNLPQIYIFLVILFPPLIYFSRTAFSEMWSAIFVLASTLLILNKTPKTLHFVFLGLILGMLTLSRYSMATWAILVMLYIVLSNINLQEKFLLNLKNISKIILKIAVGLAPFIVIIALININLYGSVFATGYQLSNEQVLSFSDFLPRVIQYTLYLNFIYPLMLFLPIFILFNKKYRSNLDKGKLLVLQLVIPATIINIIFYSLSGGFLFTGSTIDIFNALRFFVPLLPLLIIALVISLDAIKILKLIKIKFGRLYPYVRNLIIILFIVATLAYLFIVSSTHYRYIRAHYNKAFVINNYVEKDTIFVGAEEDYIYLGEHLNSNFNLSGYVDINEFKSNEDKYPQARILILEVSWETKTDRPANIMVEYIDANRNNLKLIEATQNLNIYEYKK